ncbi:MAG: 16S rRNA (uracil(1498)-N(3))-methyltransferase [Deltaproteobacteria bacterium]|nr:16S rRNA (uracil(1498)-N(3))-methyltransferase [Deltaproteobacteria bacterium]
MRRFLVHEAPRVNEPFFLVGDQAAHAAVLRLSPGEAVELFDGSGASWRAQVTSTAPGRMELWVEEKRPAGEASAIRLHLALALVKTKRMDTAVRMAAELGVAGFHPLLCDRSVPRPRDAANRMDRWRKIAVEAAKQSTNNRVMEVFPPAGLEQLCQGTRDYALRVFFWERLAGPFFLPQDAPRKGDVLAVVGPEGGFAPREVRLLESEGLVPVGLGPRILRAETAAVAACALLQYTLGDLGA